jgi:hypothetical protein
MLRAVRLFRGDLILAVLRADTPAFRSTIGHLIDRRSNGDQVHGIGC